VCGAIVGAAASALLAVALLLVFVGEAGDVGAVSAVAFIAVFVGGLAGLVGAQRMLDHPKAHTADLACAVYALTFLAVPFLIYVVAAAALLAALSSYSF
jgi:hypothetical protein